MWLEILFWSLVVFIFVFGFIYIVIGIGGFWFGIPFIPSNKKVVQKMLEMADLDSTDRVVELGCGDGRLVFDSADISKESVGCEGVFVVALWARLLQKMGKKKGTIRCINFYKEDLSRFDVVFVYLSDEIMRTLYEKKWDEFKPGCRIISNTFKFPMDQVLPESEVMEGKYKLRRYVR